MNSKTWKWVLGLTYIVAVAAIWIAASYVVQSVVDGGVSPFLITYICNSLFVVYIPIVEIGRYLEDTCGGLWFWRSKKSGSLEVLGESEQAILLNDKDASDMAGTSLLVEEADIGPQSRTASELLKIDQMDRSLPDQVNMIKDIDNQLDAKGRWTRYRVAKVSLLICPFWFFAQLSFNLSLKYTTVTVSILQLVFHVSGSKFCFTCYLA